MTTYIRAAEKHESAQGEDGTGLLVRAAVVAPLAGLAWVVFVLAVRWVLQLPPPALVRLGAVVALFAGTALIFVALVRVDLLIPPTPDGSRGRRPARGVAPPGAARASFGESAPPQAGGRALRVVRRPS